MKKTEMIKDCKLLVVKQITIYNNGEEAVK